MKAEDAVTLGWDGFRALWTIRILLAALHIVTTVLYSYYLTFIKSCLDDLLSF